MKLEKYVEVLVLYMKDELEDKAFSINNTTFDFTFSRAKRYVNASDDEVISDGEDLIAFKKLSKISDNKTIEQVIAKAMNENYIKYMGTGTNSILLTDLGLRMAKAIQINQISLIKKSLTYFADKVLVPLMVSLITAISTYYVMSYIKDKEINKEIKYLKEEIIWIKQKL